MKRAPRVLVGVAAVVGALSLGGCASYGIGIPLLPGVSLGLGYGSGSGFSVGLGTGFGPVGVGVGVNQAGVVSGGAGIGVGAGPVGVGIGTSAVLYQPGVVTPAPVYRAPVIGVPADPAAR